MAKRVKELLTASGFKRVNEDNKRGLDHGAWVPLMLMYPSLPALCTAEAGWHLSLQPGEGSEASQGGRRAGLWLGKCHSQLAGPPFRF